MVTSLEQFVFAPDPDAVRVAGAHVARVGELAPCGPTIFQKLAKELQLPEEVDFTWEGLEDGLADLSWLRTRRVAIVHDSLPRFADDDALRRYVEALANAVQRRRRRGADLVVVFPKRDRARLEEALDVDTYAAIWGRCVNSR